LKCISVFGDQIKEVKETGVVSMHWRVEICVKNIVPKPERKRPCGRPRSRWEDNNKMTLQGNTV
jgi:hypothetical protein